MSQLDVGQGSGELLAASEQRQARAAPVVVVGAQFAVAALVLWQWRGAAPPPSWLTASGLVLALVSVVVLAWAARRRPRRNAATETSIVAVVVGFASIAFTGIFAFHRSLDECFRRQDVSYGAGITRTYDGLSDQVVCHITGVNGKTGIVRIRTWNLLHS